jgi:uncharacterized membrane protein
MSIHYNAIAGKNLDRLTALSDGVFAFAMTLLVLDLRVPAGHLVHSEGDLIHALVLMAPRLVPYLLSFITLGIFWMAQQAQFNLLQKSDRDVGWIHIAFLAGISLVPFSTALLAEFLTYKTALLVYWANIFVGGMLLLTAWMVVRRRGLLKPDVPAEVNGAIVSRILGAQALYAFGAALCLIDNWWAIGFIVAVQIGYATAFPIRPFRD